MAKRKPTKKKEVLDNRGLCPGCLAKGNRVKMSPRGSDAVACPKCNMWCEKHVVAETKEEKKARLKAELAALEAE